jgi:hypothetical protein
MPPCLASKKIRPKTFPNCAPWRPIAPPLIFAAGPACPIKWRGISRRPIPANWHFIGQRSSPFHLAGNRNAAHPVNAILNYAYATLESEIRITAIADGYDPTIGILHEGNNGSSKFIFDFMEPERPKVDRAALDFVKGHVFDSADFVIRTDGVCRLNPEMARMLVAEVSALEKLLMPTGRSRRQAVIADGDGGSRDWDFSR